MRRLVSWVVTIRELFNSKKFDLLNDTIINAEHDHNAHDIFKDYPICLNEINNCKQHIKHNAMMNKLIDIIKDPVFETCSIDLNHRYTLLKNINKKYEDVNNALTFTNINTNTNETGWPRLLSLVLLCEDLLQIYQLVEKTNENIDRLFDDLFKAHSAVLKR